MRGLSRRTAVAAFASLSLVSAGLAANTVPRRPAKPHHLLVQVDQNDLATMNLALNNVINTIEYYRAKGEEVNVDVVTYGPGLQMLRDDTSPVKDRIKTLKELAFPSKVQFSACFKRRSESPGPGRSCGRGRDASAGNEACRGRRDADLLAHHDGIGRRHCSSRRSRPVRRDSVQENTAVGRTSAASLRGSRYTP